MTDPTLGEVMRRLDEVSRQMADQATQLRNQQMENARIFQTRELAKAQREADQAALAALEKDLEAEVAQRKQDVAWRRQVQLTLGALAITCLVSICIAVLGLIVR